MNAIESSLRHKVFIVIIAVSVTGCATLQPVANTPPPANRSNPAEPAAQTGPATGSETNPHAATVQGAIGGALIGGLAAALLGGNDDRGRNAAIGAAAGTLIGGLVGSEIDKRRQQYASTEDFYDAQIRQTAQLNQALAENNRNLRNSVQADQNEINSLVARYQAGQATKTQLLASRQRIEQNAASNRQKLATAQKELQFQREVLNELQARGPSPRSDEMRRQVAQLESEINSLQQTVNQMASQSTTLGRYM